MCYLDSKPTWLIFVILIFMSSQLNAQNVLFVRGAERSGGATEGSGVSDPRDIRGFTEQLADIRDPAGSYFSNNPTGSGNHSWFEFATLLDANGYHVEQTTESVEAGAPAKGPTDGAPVTFGAGFETETFADLNAETGNTQFRNLAFFDIVVFGSNNAVYQSSQINAVDNFIRGGGSAIFISDANFGSERGDAASSDQQFLSRFGITMNEDRGTYSLRRNQGEPGFEEFRDPNSDILAGVNEYMGEGVSPLTIPANSNSLPADVTANIIGGIPAGQTIRQPGGNTRPATVFDASILAVEAGAGQFIGYYDRNTFFNPGGAGSNINRFEHQQLALNIFEFLVPVTEIVPPTGFSIFRGFVVGGVTISDFTDSDDQSASFNPGFVLSSDESPVWLNFNSVANTASAIHIESTGNTPGLEYIVEAFNWTTSQFEIVGTAPETFNSDSISEFLIAPEDHIEPGTGNVSCQIGWRAAGFTLLFPWQVDVDRVGWVQ